MGTLLPSVKRTEVRRPLGSMVSAIAMVFRQTVAPALHARRWRATEPSTTAVLYETRIRHGPSGSAVVKLLGQLVGQ